MYEVEREGTYNASRRSRSMSNIYSTSSSPAESRYSTPKYDDAISNMTYGSYHSVNSRTSNKSAQPSSYIRNAFQNSRKTPSPENPKLRFSRHSGSLSSRKETPGRNNQIQTARNRNKPLRRSLSVSEIRHRSPSPSKPRRKPRINSQDSSTSSSNCGPFEPSQVTEVIIRKISKDGRWFEEREEINSIHKKDGKNIKKVNKTMSNLNAIDSDELMKSIANYGNEGSENLDLERSSQLYSSHGRGLIQDNQQAFAKEILTRINAFRVQHLVKTVKLNENLNYYAREWGKYLAHVGESSFTNRDDLGESIFVKKISQPFAKIDGDGIINLWYSEISKHDFHSPTEVTAPNFTQMIWKSSREIGVTIERSLNGKTSYVVVFYYPKGNDPSDQDKQVPPVGGFSSKERNEKGFIQPHVSEKDERFLPSVMRAVNFYRLKHGAIPLQLDESLTDHAQEWAEQLAKEDRIRSRPRNVYGENIYCSSFQNDSEIPGKEPVEYWYKKRRFHNYASPGDVRAAAFTQLVWQDSRDIGIGRAQSRSGKIYVVANFNPPGNLVGSFEKHVTPKKWE